MEMKEEMTVMRGKGEKGMMIVVDVFGLNSRFRKGRMCLTIFSDGF